MTLRIMRLEERIVLEGTGFDRADPDHADGADHVAAPVVALGDTARAHAATDAPAAMAAGDSGGSAQSQGGTPLLLDGTGESESGAGPGAGPRLVVVGSDVRDAGTLAGAVADAVATVRFDTQAATLDVLLGNMRDALGGRKADSIAFAAHDAGPGRFALTRDQTVSIASLVFSPVQQKFWRGVGSMVRENGRIDILACNLASTEGGRLLVNELEHLTERNIAASDDVTANPGSGGDWTLETDDIDAAAAYFDADKLAAFNGALAVSPVISNLDASVSFNENTVNGAPQQVDADVAVANGDGTGYDGGSLTVSFGGNAAASDALSIDTTGNFGITGNILDYSSTNIGTIVSDGAGGNDLVVNFDLGGSTTDAMLSELLRAVRLRNVADDPVGDGVDGPRVLTFTVVDAEAESDAHGISVSITPVDDAPTFSASLSVDEGQTVTLAVGDFNISDPDTAAADLDITVSGLTHGRFEDTGAPGTAITTFTLAQVQANQVIFVHDGAPTAPSYDVQVNDATTTVGGPDAATITFTANQDDAPVLTPTGSALSYTEGDGAVNIDPGLDFTDEDDTQFTGAVIEITANYAGGEDFLAAGSMDPSISVDGSSTADRLVLTGTSTLGLYRTALRNATFQNTSDAPSVNTRTITFSLTDANSVSDPGGAATGSTTRDITLAAVDDAPVPAANNPLALNEGATAAIDHTLLETTDVDTGADNLVYTVTQAPGQGQAWIDSDLDGGINGGEAALAVNDTFTQAQIDAGALKYAHAGGETTADLFKFTVADATTTLSEATFNINVTAVNDAPVVVVNNSALTFNEGSGATVIDPGVTLSDADDTNITGAVIEITGGYVPGEDTLAIGTLYGGIALDGSSTASKLVLINTASLADYRNTLRELTYDNANNANPNLGARTVSFTVTDENASGGAGGTRNGADTRTVNIQAINDAPGVTAAAGTLDFTEDAAPVAVDAALVISDVDDANLSSATVRVTGNYVNGEDVLDFTDTADFTHSWDAAGGTLTLSAVGGPKTVTQWRDALRTVTYQNVNTGDPSTSNRVVTFSATDGNSDGNGLGAATGSDARVVAITDVNDAPVISTPPGAAASTMEDTPLDFTDTIQVSDPDVGGGSMRVTLDATVGTLSLSQTTNLSFTTGDGADDSSMDFTGAIADINAALNGMTLTPPADYAGVSTVDITVNDQNNSGALGGAKGDSANVAVTVNAVNDAPVNSVPGGQSMVEDATLYFNAANGNQVSVSDIDVGAGQMQLQLVASDGTATLGGVTGLTFSVGDGVADASMTFTGSLTDVNAALDNLRFDPDADFTGTAQVQIVSGDQGNSGSGGAKSDTDAIAIAVAGVNDAPVLSVPAGPFVADEQVDLTINGISVSDVDGGGSTNEISISTNQGNISLNSVAGLTLVSGGDGTGDMTYRGTLAAINNALNGITYNNPADRPLATDSVVLTYNDRGNSGAGGALSDTRSFQVNVNQVNDAPNVTVPGTPLNATEQTALVIDSVSIADPDNPTESTNEITITVAAGGRVRLATLSGLVLMDGSDNTGFMKFQGSLANINSALDGMQYLHDSDTPPANDTITIAYDDRGNVGSGGAGTDTRVVTINLAPVNDAPDIDAVTTLDFHKGDPSQVLAPALLLSDVDDSRLEQVTLRIGGYVKGEDVMLFDFKATDPIHASWDADTGTLVLFAKGGGGNSETINRFRDALRAVRFQNASNVPDGSTSTRTIQYAVDDLNESGASNGVQSDSYTQTVNLIGNAKQASTLEEPPPPPTSAATGGDTGPGAGEGGAGESAGGDIGGGGGAGTGDSGSGNILDSTDDNTPTYDDNAVSFDTAPAPAVDFAPRLVDGSSESDLALAAIKHADSVVYQAEATLGRLFAAGADPAAADAPLLRFTDIFARMQDDFLTLKQGVKDAARALMEALDATQDVAEHASDGLLRDVIASHTYALNHAAQNLEVFSLVVQRGNLFLREHPDTIAAEFIRKLEELRVLILREIQMRQAEADGILKDAARSYIEQKRGAGHAAGGRRPPEGAGE